ncbi:MAG: hypothetical protein QHH15_00535 [Candidatus Thermoplasmatota archaeon]|nr:hypothetical protein [Candidatus Thermoplasmatota archaeon]MDH7506261.1 hypothetical protein [Candidatus Thermoplasmatota archaeon]
MKVKDTNGEEIWGYNFGEIERGDITNPVPIVLYNDTAYDSNGIIVKGSVSLFNHRGLPDDTYESTFISLDGKNALLKQTINIPSMQKKVIYLHFQPTYLAEPSNYQWSLLIQERDF